MVEHPTADEMDDALTAAHEHLSATDGETFAASSGEE